MPIQMGDSLKERLEKMVHACKQHCDEHHAIEHANAMPEPHVLPRAMGMVPGKPLTVPQPKR